MNIRRYFDYQVTTPLAIVQVALIGLMTGAVMWLIYSGLNSYLLTPILCKNNSSYCVAAPNISLVTAILLAHFAGLIVLVRLLVVRPLLVVLATIMTLLGFHQWLTGESWWLATLLTGVLVALSYVFYAWVNRLKLFPVALILTALAVLAIRLVITS